MLTAVITTQVLAVKCKELFVGSWISMWSGFSSQSHISSGSDLYNVQEPLLSLTPPLSTSYFLFPFYWFFSPWLPRSSPFSPPAQTASIKCVKLEGSQGSCHMSHLTFNSNFCCLLSLFKWPTSPPFSSSHTVVLPSLSLSINVLFAPLFHHADKLREWEAKLD